MAEKPFDLFDPPQFLVCDDVRREIGGKNTIVGVYPGNAIAVASFPIDLFFHVWALTIPTFKGSAEGAYRVIGTKDGVPVFETPTKYNISVPHIITPMGFVAAFQATAETEFQAQIRVGDQPWLTLGKFWVERHRTPPGARG